jgi:hypothetical protein
MKLIKKATKQEMTANTLVQAGDRVLVQPQANHDGRGGWDLPPKIKMTVLKVNKYTFDAEDVKGNVYRVDIREDKFQVAVAKSVAKRKMTQKYIDKMTLKINEKFRNRSKHDKPQDILTPEEWEVYSLRFQGGPDRTYSTDWVMASR